MQADLPISDLPSNFRHEQKQLVAAGISHWNELRALDDCQISKMIKGQSTARNFKRLRGIAVLVCDLDLAAADAALLMHAGLATVADIARSTPQTIVQNTGRLERQLQIGRPPVVDLATANRWIQLARRRQLKN